MKKGKSILISITVILLSISLLQISTTSIGVNSKASLTFIEKIEVDSDTDFETYATSGDGSENKPYIIEDYNVTSSTSSGIRIRFTTKHFIVRNCYVKGHFTGINLIGISNGTGKVINNEIELNNKGISLSSVNHSEIAYNTIVNNTQTGIILGIEAVGVEPLYGNTIHHNNFLGNDWFWVNDVYTPTSDHQAIDEGIENFWYDNSTNEGNYWDDYGGSGSYTIEGETGSVDPYPLSEETNYSTVESPVNYIVVILSLSLSSVLFLVKRKKE